MNNLDKSIITLCLTICVLILLVINLTLGINYIKQLTMNKVLQDCRIDAEEQLHIESY